MIRSLIALAWAFATCSGQVSLSLSVVPNAAARRMLNKRAASLVSPWIGTATNNGAERVLVTESAVITAMVRYQPFDHAAMSLLVQDASTYSLLARLGRGGQDVIALGAFIAAQKSWGSPWIEILTGVSWGGPYIVNRLQGVARPVGQNYETLAAGWPIQLDAGQSAVFHVFTSHWPDSAAPAVFTLGGGVSVRMVQ